eukprot:scaffold214478_cov17-Tisochrysis_lutea.AAC.1
MLMLCPCAAHSLLPEHRCTELWISHLRVYVCACVCVLCARVCADVCVLRPCLTFSSYPSFGTLSQHFPWKPHSSGHPWYLQIWSGALVLTCAHWFDPPQEFVVHTPNTLSQKYWITNGAVHAQLRQCMQCHLIPFPLSRCSLIDDAACRHAFVALLAACIAMGGGLCAAHLPLIILPYLLGWAVVFAQLICQGTNHGVHGLLVRIRCVGEVVGGGGRPLNLDERFTQSSSPVVGLMALPFCTPRATDGNAAVKERDAHHESTVKVQHSSCTS